MNNFNIAIIAPTKYLGLFSNYKGNNYHMVLAHRYLTDSLYKRFYDIKSAKSDSVIILDNGACELKSSITNKKLYKAAVDIKPHVIVLPDVLGNASLTVRRSFGFIADYKILKKIFGVKFMAVPQGRLLKSWMKAFDSFYSSDDVDMIGLSNVSALNIQNKANFNRVDAIEYLLSEGYLFENKKIHILGLGDSGHLEILGLKKYDFVEGVDTSAPIVHGYYNVLFQDDKNYSKIKSYLPDDLQSMDESQIDNIFKNIEIFYETGRN